MSLIHREQDGWGDGDVATAASPIMPAAGATRFAEVPRKGEKCQGGGKRQWSESVRPPGRLFAVAARGRGNAAVPRRANQQRPDEAGLQIKLTSRRGGGCGRGSYATGSRHLSTAQTLKTGLRHP